MLEIHPGMAAILVDAGLRLWLVGFGLVLAGHYHCMANFITAAPHWMRVVLLPLLTATGIGMAYCGVAGSVAHGALFGLAAAGLMTLVNLAAFGAGAYVSRQMARADKMRRHRKAFMLGAVDGAEGLAELLEKDSDAIPLTASDVHKAAAARANPERTP